MYHYQVTIVLPDHTSKKPDDTVVWRRVFVEVPTQEDVFLVCDRFEGQPSASPAERSINLRAMELVKHAGMPNCPGPGKASRTVVIAGTEVGKVIIEPIGVIDNQKPKCLNTGTGAEPPLGVFAPAIGRPYPLGVNAPGFILPTHGYDSPPTLEATNDGADHQ